MKYNRNPLSQAIGTTLCTSAVASLALASGVAFAQDEADEEGVELDRVQVTGSRIKRVDIEGATPVTVINREEIDLSGDVSVSELLRSTPFNSFGSFTEQSGFANAQAGTAAVSLRGLGSQRTLVLIDLDMRLGFQIDGAHLSLRSNRLLIDDTPDTQAVITGAQGVHHLFKTLHILAQAARGIATAAAGLQDF